MYFICVFWSLGNRDFEVPEEVLGKRRRKKARPAARYAQLFDHIEIIYSKLQTIFLQFPMAGSKLCGFHSR